MAIESDSDDDVVVIEGDELQALISKSPTGSSQIRVMRMVDLIARSQRRNGTWELLCEWDSVYGTFQLWEPIETFTDDIGALVQAISEATPRNGESPARGLPIIRPSIAEWDLDDTTNGSPPDAGLPMYIEKILAYREVAGNPEVLIKWLHLPLVDCTWESLENILDPLMFCAEIESVRRKWATIAGRRPLNTPMTRISEAAFRAAKITGRPLKVNSPERQHRPEYIQRSSHRQSAPQRALMVSDTAEESMSDMAPSRKRPPPSQDDMEVVEEAPKRHRIADVSVTEPARVAPAPPTTTLTTDLPEPTQINVESEVRTQSSTPPSDFDANKNKQNETSRLLEQFPLPTFAPRAETTNAPSSPPAQVPLPSEQRSQPSSPPPAATPVQALISNQPLPPGQSQPTGEGSQGINAPAQGQNLNDSETMDLSADQLASSKRRLPPSLYDRLRAKRRGSGVSGDLPPLPAVIPLPPPNLPVTQADSTKPQWLETRDAVISSTPPPIALSRAVPPPAPPAPPPPPAPPVAPPAPPPIPPSNVPQQPGVVYAPVAVGMPPMLATSPVYSTSSVIVRSRGSALVPPPPIQQSQSRDLVGHPHPSSVTAAAAAAYLRGQPFPSRAQPLLPPSGVPAMSVRGIPPQSGVPSIVGSTRPRTSSVPHMSVASSTVLGRTSSGLPVEGSTSILPRTSLPRDQQSASARNRTSSPSRSARSESQKGASANSPVSVEAQRETLVKSELFQALRRSATAVHNVYAKRDEHGVKSLHCCCSAKKVNSEPHPLLLEAFRRAGFKDPVHSAAVRCTLCDCASHLGCSIKYMESEYGEAVFKQKPETILEFFNVSSVKRWCSNFLCLACRLVLLDPLHPLVEIMAIGTMTPVWSFDEARLRRTNLTEMPKPPPERLVLGTHITASEAAEFKAGQKTLQLRAFKIRSDMSSYPRFPNDEVEIQWRRVGGRAMGQMKLPKPSHLRIRKDTVHNIPPSIGEERGPGQVEVKISAHFEHICDGPYLFALVKTFQVSPSRDFVGLLQKQGVADYGHCVQHALALIGPADEEEDADDDEDIQLVNLRPMVKLTCPSTMLRMDIPARGVLCKHVQCFDLAFFLESQSTSIHQARWKCPVCRNPCRPHELMIDSWLAEVLRTAAPDIIEITMKAGPNNKLRWEPSRRSKLMDGRGSTASGSEPVCVDI